MFFETSNEAKKYIRAKLQKRIIDIPVALEEMKKKLEKQNLAITNALKQL